MGLLAASLCLHAAVAGGAADQQEEEEGTGAGEGYSGHIHVWP